MSQSDRTDDPESPSQRQRTTAPAPMYDVDVPRASWFEHLFGFREEEAKGELLHERLELRGDMLHSRVNGASYAAGVFSTPSLGELRAAAADAALPRGELQVSHIQTRDVFELHSRDEFAGAMFQAASQFNCLEFASPGVTPERGVTGYIYDGLQRESSLISPRLALLLGRLTLRISLQARRARRARSPRPPRPSRATTSSTPTGG